MSDLSRTLGYELIPTPPSTASEIADNALDYLYEAWQFIKSIKLEVTVDDIQQVIRIRTVKRSV